MTLYLVIDYDDHTDPEYHLRRDKQAALDLAQQFSDRSQKSYGDMPRYSYPCDGKYGTWFNECGEDRWRVTVCGVELQ